jgi:DNA helicase II / ATP-dependent DNA helicase PcrA
MFHADLHIHSKYSRACSKDCDIPHLAAGALRKGISVVGTGDFTHPAWAGELKDCLVPAEDGLLRLRPDLEKDVRRRVPASCGQPVRFMLSVEISTIYRRADRTRKVHHLIYAPTLEAAGRITTSLSKIGNLASDGRPILGLDSRDLLEITLEGGPDCYLVPAHIWTPWFAVLGSRSGFDAVADCYGDLAGEIFAVETGLSSDPAMNWMCSSLDSYRLVSNSDAHSPPMLGREATAFTAAMDYFSIAEALRTGDGLAGTIEFYPEEGKYHLDGHRKCGVRLDPRQTREADGTCPECHKPLTVGVLHRVTELADRPGGYRPDGAAGFDNLVQLPEIIGEILSVGPRSKSVAGVVDRLVASFGPELAILRDVPAGDLARVGGATLGEAITRLRLGKVDREAGFDGEYGRVRLFADGELTRADALFDVPAVKPVKEKRPATERDRGASSPATGDVPPPPGRTGRQPGPRATRGAATLLDGLDAEQRAAVQADGPLMIIAGPGTGKTRTLTHRIAFQMASQAVPADRFLAVTFTRRAAGEMRDRLSALMASGAGGSPVPLVTTFHGLALRLLRDHPERAGLPPGFGVADDAARLEAAAVVAGSDRDGRRLLAALGGRSGDDDVLTARGKALRDAQRAAQREAPAAQREALRAELAARGLIDLDDLTGRAAGLLADDPALAAAYRDRWPWISVDEYQDLDGQQYELLRLLAGPGAGLTVIGDPDQAIYGFRGADVGFFLRFSADYPAAATVSLTRNYRSRPAIVTGALQAITPATLVPGRELRAAATDPGRGGPAIVRHEAASEQAEGTWIAEEIDRLIGGSSFHSLDSGRVDARQRHAALGLSDIAVLYRTDAQATSLAQALTRAGLPFQKRSHDRLSRRPGVRDIAAQMRLAGPADAEDGAEARLRRALDALTSLMPHGSAAAVDVRAAGEVLTPLARRCGGDAGRFLTEISLGAEADALDPRADAVTLLTLHAAKGLEFDVVFIAGCERGLLPLWLPGPGLADPAEERRLLFVGMTRARDRLFLSYAARRSRPGGPGGPGGPADPSAAGPSPFLDAIDPALISQTASARRPPPDRQLRLL